jgi:hypothetical protein
MSSEDLIRRTFGFWKAVNELNKLHYDDAVDRVNSTSNPINIKASPVASRDIELCG